MKIRSSFLALIKPNNAFPAEWGVFSLVESRWLDCAFATKSGATRAIKLLDIEAAMLELVASKVILWN